MTDELPFPVTDEELFRRARSALALQGWKVAGHPLAEDVPLRIGDRYVLRRGADGRPVAYSVSVLVDPRLGVPCDTPDAEPRWGSQVVLSLMFDENGDALQREAM